MRNTVSFRRGCILSPPFTFIRSENGSHRFSFIYFVFCFTSTACLSITHCVRYPLRFSPICYHTRFASLTPSSLRTPFQLYYIIHIFRTFIQNVFQLSLFPRNEVAFAFDFDFAFLYSKLTNKKMEYRNDAHNLASKPRETICFAFL